MYFAFGCLLKPEMRFANNKYCLLMIDSGKKDSLLVYTGMFIFSAFDILYLQCV